MQDGLKSFNIKVLEWPGNSSDYNPIENVRVLKFLEKNVTMVQLQESINRV